MAERIISLSEDRTTARVVWRGPPGTYAFKPHPRMIDVAYIVYGRVVIYSPGQAAIWLAVGSLIEFPREPFDPEIIDIFI